MWLFSSSSMLFYTPFVSASMLGVVMALSSTNWFMVWAGLEINMYSFIPLLLHLDMSKRKESAAKYFLAQATGSTLLLMATLTSYSAQNMSSMLFLAAILLKGGFAPCHYWYPSVMAASPWLICLMLSTIQKIAPALLLINMMPQNQYTLIFIGVLMILVGGLAGVNQTQFRAIMAYSSIAQVGWITMASQVSTTMNLLMLFNYMFTVMTIMIIMAFNELNTGTEAFTSWGTQAVTKFMIMFQMISLGGVPPFTGFMFKAMVISALMSKQYTFATMLAIIGSVMSLYFYIKVVFLALFMQPKNTFMNYYMMTMNQKSVVLFMASVVTFPIILIMWPWLMA